jgi:reverse transcriptase-like protein
MDIDASDFALGAIISQEFNNGKHPIAFHSHTLLPAEQNYDVHDKEMATIIYGFKCSCPYFLGTNHPIHVRTDHKNLQYFCQPQKITGRQARWMEFLQDFDFVLTTYWDTLTLSLTSSPTEKTLTRGWISKLTSFYPFSFFFTVSSDPMFSAKPMWKTT